MKHNNIKKLLALFIAVTVFASSCQKDSGADDLGTGQATITINMKGIGASTGNSNSSLRSSTSSSKNISAVAVQSQVIKFNEQYNVTATLREVTSATATALRASANRSEVTATGEGDILPLENGTDYTIKVYKDGTEVHTETFTQGEGEHTFNIDAGSYTYVAYAYGNASVTGADRDPLWVSGTLNVTAGAENTLSVVLEHKLTEVTVVFNAGAGRTISAIGNTSTIAPNYNYTFNEETGVVTFGTVTTAANIAFSNQTVGQTWTSAPTMIAVEDTDNGTVELTGVTINGTNGAVSSDGWALRAGVQYILELNLGDKEEEEGIALGGKIWAPGNLVYNNGTYSFAAPTEFGSYWYYNWLTPQGVGTAPTYQQMLAYDQDRDPCKQVSAAWRTPSQAEYQDLLATDGAATDWQYKNNGTEGVFYGSTNLQAMSQNPSEYLFFIGTTSGTSAYWSSTSLPGSDNATARSYYFGGYNKPSPTSTQLDDKSYAFQIRCVRD